jgi:hypothetical protein
MSLLRSLDLFGPDFYKDVTPTAFRRTGVAFGSPRGASCRLEEEKKRRGFDNRDDVQTTFDFHKADEA